MWNRFPRAVATPVIPLVRRANNRPRALSRLGSIGLVVLTFTGCTATPVTSPTPGGPTWPSDTMYGRLFAQVGADGSVSKELALQAFSTAIAPLPGVPPSDGAPPTDAERADGTFAVMWIMPYLDELTPEQRAVVDSVLTPPPSAVLVHPPRLIAALGPGAPPLDASRSDAESKPYTDAIAAAEATIASRLNRELQAHIFFGFDEAPADKPEALAFAYPLGVAGPNFFCGVRATPALEGSSQTRINVAMAHEVFHCFQFEAMPDHGRTKGLSWIVEGQAEWAGEDVAGPGQDGRDWWANYLASPGQPLFARTYDAVGFYEHLSEAGTNPWDVFDAMLANVNDNVDAFKASRADDDGFFNTWASGLFRATTLPGAWYAQERWNVSGSAPIYSVNVFGNADRREIKAVAVTTQQWLINSQADVTELAFQGHVRMHTGGQEIPRLTEDVYLCTQQGPDACKCPAGLAYSGPLLYDSDGVVYLALTGSLTETQGFIEGHPLQEFCEPEPVEPPDGDGDGGWSCNNDCASSNGDPHLTTVDGVAYDFQAAGEFTMLGSPDGGFEVQARQEPYQDSDHVTINTALAVGLGGDRVAGYVTPDGVRVLVNGAELAEGTSAAVGSLQVAPISDGIRVSAPDGTAVWITGMADDWGLGLLISPSDGLRASGRGMLGPAGEGRLPALPDGAAVDAEASYRDAIYRDLANAWAVSESTSLFDYAPGEGPSSFRDLSIPAGEAPLDFSELTPEQQQAGLAACAAIADESLREQCAFDVAVTGDGGFVDAYAATDLFLAQLGGDACGLLTDQEIESITGFAVLGEEAGAAEGTAGCRWEVDSGPDYSEPFVVEVDVYHSGGAREFEFGDEREIEDLGLPGDRTGIGCFGFCVLVLRGDMLLAVGMDAIIVRQETLIPLARAALARL